MTQEEKLAILADAEARCYGALKTVTPGEDMDHILENLSDIEWRQDAITGERDRRIAEAAGKWESNEPTKPESPTPVKLDPIEEPKPDSVTDALTFAEVKKKMIQYQTTHNLDIASLMQSMGYQKLSEIPAEKYDELLRRAEAKIKEKD